MTLRVGVDGWNLCSDRRGMGRFTRQVLQAAYDAPDFSVTLIAPQPQAAKYSAILERDVREVVSVREMGARILDVVWYPWNGMRFVHAAPKVVTIHDVFAFSQPRRNLVARLREQQPIRRAASRADCVATVSQWSAGQIAHALGIAAANIRVIPHAPATFWRPAQSPAPRSRYFLFVSGPERRKNAALLFAAFQEAFSAGEVELIIAGTLSERDRKVLEQTRISFRHLQPDDEQLRTLYTGALAVTVPSVAEGFGLVAVEAMACGAAVLAADAAALPEACGEGAELLSPHSREAWSSALRRVWEDAAFREELQIRAARRMAQFERAGPAREMLALLREIAALRNDRQSHASVL